MPMFLLSHVPSHVFFQTRVTKCDVGPKESRKWSGSCDQLKRCFPESKSLPLLVHAGSLARGSFGVSEFLNGAGCAVLSEDYACEVGRCLQSCSNVEEVQKVHFLVDKKMGNLPGFVGNNLISMYAKFGEMASAHKVFDKMSERDVVSWTALMNGYMKHGFFGDALSLFAEFVRLGVRWTGQTFVCVLNLCGKTSDYELGRQLHACAVKNKMNNFVLDSTILHFYAQCGDLDSAVDVFEQMERRDVVAWTTMITGYSRHDQGQEAFAMFSKMLCDGFEPNEYTVCSLLDACGCEKELTFGKQLHAVVLKNAYCNDVYVGTSLLDMYAKCGKMEESRAVFDEMKTKNKVTWNSILSGYARNGMGEEALRFFHVMKRLKHSANELTMVSILRACGSIKGLCSGKEVHAHIFRNFSPVQILMGTELVWFYCQCEDYISASKVLRSLPEKDVVSWTTMISGCTHKDNESEALKYMNEMLHEGIEPNPFTYSSVLKACAKLEDIKQGKLIHSSVNKTAALQNVFVGSALIHMYSQCGYLQEAARVFDDMPEKNAVSWKAMIMAYAKNGWYSEAMKLVYRMQAEGIEIDERVQSAVLTSCSQTMFSKIAN